VSPGDIDEDRFSDFSELGDDEFDATVGVAPASGSDDPVPPFVAGGASSSSAAVFPSVAACQVCEDPELGSAAGSVALFCPDGSKIVYYRSDGRFEATCGNIKHGVAGSRGQASLQMGVCSLSQAKADLWVFCLHGCLVASYLSASARGSI
jgi:hypothetical protein